MGVLVLQRYLQSQGIMAWACLMDYEKLSLGALDRDLIHYHERLIVWAMIFGLGTILGDMAGSFLKRKYFKIPPGGKCCFLDQLDFVAGVFVFVFLFSDFGVWHWIIISSVTLLLQPLASIIGYHLRIKKVKH